jgi:hypothetical protein
MTEHVSRSGTLDPCYWLVGVIDLLGQQEAFLKTDYIPTDDENAKPFIAALQASLGAIRGMRNTLKSFREALTQENPNAHAGLTPEQRVHARRMNLRQVDLRPLSDAMMITSTLKPNDGHRVPMLGVYDVLLTCMQQMLMQLSIGYPIRGGLDVGTGLVAEGEFFGAALVKAYQLESKAEHPRLVVGDGLVKYLDVTTKPEGQAIEQQFTAALAVKCRTFVIRDEDGKWILDYAGPAVRAIFPPEPIGQTVAQSLDFARKSRERFQKDGNQKLFDRYSKLVRYLDSRAALWI